jgi:hypothetical protein
MALTLVFCGFFYACNETEQVTNPKFEAITGKFLNQEGNPIAGITVEATDANGNLFSTDVTDANGFFKIQNVPNDLTNGIVSFVDAGEIIHQSKLKTVVNSIGKSGDVFQGDEDDFEAVIKLTIKDTETDLPIVGADVQLATSQNAAFNKVSDADGNVFFENTVAGRYTLRISKTD